MRATVEVVQCRAVDVEPGDTVRVTPNEPWQLVIDVLVNGNTGQYHDYKDVEDVVRAVDDWYVVLCMNKLPNRLYVTGGKVRTSATGMAAEYDHSGPDVDVAVLFQDALVDVQVRHERLSQATT